MKVLFVAPWLPSKVRPRSLEILKTLCSSHDVWFVGLENPGDRYEELHQVHLARTTIVHARPLRNAVRALAAIPSRRSLQEAYVRDPRVRKQIRLAIRHWNPDVIHMNVVRSCAYLRDIDDGTRPIVFDLDELRSDFYTKSRHGQSTPIRKLLATVEAPRMRTSEQRALTASRAVLFSSPVDAAASGSKATLVRSPVAPSALERKPTPLTMLFVGRMRYSANVEGIRWFCKEVLPPIALRHPGVRLDIVGESPSKAVRDLASDNVTVWGWVDEIDRFYQRAAVCITPVRLSTGVQLKLVQALAAAVPVVTFEDCAYRAGVTRAEALTAETASEWVQAIGSIFTDPGLAQSLSASGQRWADENYSPGVIARSLNRVYDDIERVLPHTERR